MVSPPGNEFVDEHGELDLRDAGNGGLCVALGAVNGVSPFICLGGTNFLAPSGGFDPEKLLRPM